MDKKQLAEVFSLLGSSAKPWYYFPGKYALDQLQRIVKDGPMTVSALKKSRHARWLQKASVNRAIASLPEGVISCDGLIPTWWEQPMALNYSLGQWGTSRKADQQWQQTSRPGYNLVVQVNLTKGMELQYEKRAGLSRLHAGWGHPVSKEYPTLGWVRLDFDWDQESVLIEEVQSDLVRMLPRRVKQLRHVNTERSIEIREGTRRFLQEEFAVYAKYWQEAVLACALEVIDQELGFRSVYMHSWEGGNALKNIHSNARPPRSLYTQLPKKFGFQRTNEPPACLFNQPAGLSRKQERILLDADWWHLAW